MSIQAQKGGQFVKSHVEAGIVVLPNAWDAGSAVMMVEAGFSAIATTTGRSEQPLFDFELACDRIRAGAESARSAAVPFVLNARTDPYLVRHGSADVNFAEAVRRANAFREAGADCLFVPGPLDAETIGRLVREIHGPLNVLGARGGSASALSIPELGRLGVRRVSIGGSLSVAALGFVQQAMRELREHGTFGYAPSAPSNAGINAIMARYRG